MDNKSDSTSQKPKLEQFSPQIKSTSGLKRKGLEKFEEGLPHKSAKLEVNIASTKLENTRNIENTQTATQSPKRELEVNHKTPEIEINSHQDSKKVLSVCTCTYENQLECPHAYKAYMDYYYPDSSDEDNTPIQGTLRWPFNLYC